MLSELEKSELIHKKDLGDGIVSYNFTRKAFYNSAWDNLTVTARGLFFDTESKKILARSYKKFFNLEERPETEWRNLKVNLQFPVSLYLKENGFLGLASYNPKTDDLFISSKSTNKGEYAGYFKTLLLEALGDKVEDFKQFLKDENVTAIFEVIDIVNDPHIIEYDKSGVVLLDIVHNDFTNSFYHYSALKSVGYRFDLPIKILYAVCNNFDELKSTLESFTVDCEGFVIKDDSGFMFKYKTPFYRFWKEVRKYKDMIIKDKEIGKTSNEMAKVIDFMKTFSKEDLCNMSVINIRNQFEQNGIK